MTKPESFVSSSQLPVAQPAYQQHPYPSPPYIEMMGLLLSVIVFLVSLTFKLTNRFEIISTAIARIEERINSLEERLPK